MISPKLVQTELDAFLKLQLLRATHSLVPEAVAIEPIDTASGNYFRVDIQLRDRDSHQSFQSMAESTSRRQALLLAMAEAYEQFSLARYRTRHPDFFLARTSPFGIGVGWRRRSALLRAWGEYHERRLAGEFDDRSSGKADFSEMKVFHIPSEGPVYVALGRFLGGRLGTGYGLTPDLALNSALRSALRKRDFPQQASRFDTSSTLAATIDITPQDPSAAWLRCFLISHSR